MADSLRVLPPEDLQAAIASLTEAEADELLHDWSFWARPSQLPPSWDWTIWVFLAGRGTGKTRSAAEWVKDEEARAREPQRWAFIAQTPADARDIMIEGESGLLSVYQDRARPLYEPSKRRITWPRGSQATIYSVQEYEQLRGPQHHRFWAEELAAWKFPQEAWDMLMFGLRLGDHPRGIVTTTPKPIPLLKGLLARERTAQNPAGDVAVTRGTTYENRSNLAPSFFSEIITKYEGTRLGRQELNAEILEDAEGALWRRDQIDALRVQSAPELARVVVAIDPATSSKATSNETGIVVAGIGECLCKGEDKPETHGFVLDDLSGIYQPADWGQRSINAYRAQLADRIVAEVNNGGEMVGHVLKQIDKAVAFKAVHASRGKRARAEPVAALTEQGKIHHVGSFPALEDQLCGWEPLSGQESPDRLDAYVWAFSDLIVTAPRQKFLAKSFQG